MPWRNSIARCFYSLVFESTNLKFKAHLYDGAPFVCRKSFISHLSYLISSCPTVCFYRGAVFTADSMFSFSRCNYFRRNKIYSIRRASLYSFFGYKHVESGKLKFQEKGRNWFAGWRILRNTIIFCYLPIKLTFRKYFSSCGPTGAGFRASHK